MADARKETYEDLPTLDPRFKKHGAFRFLDLPTDVRFMVYKFFWPERKELRLPTTSYRYSAHDYYWQAIRRGRTPLSHDDRANDLYYWRTRKSPFLALIETNRTLSREVSQFFFGITTVVVDMGLLLWNWFGDQRFRPLQHLALLFRGTKVKASLTTTGKAFALALCKSGATLSSLSMHVEESPWRWPYPSWDGYNSIVPWNEWYLEVLPLLPKVDGPVTARMTHISKEGLEKWEREAEHERLITSLAVDQKNVTIRHEDDRGRPMYSKLSKDIVKSQRRMRKKVVG